MLSVSHEDNLLYRSKRVCLLRGAVPGLRDRGVRGEKKHAVLFLLLEGRELGRWEGRKRQREGFGGGDRQESER